ncbi:MAG: DUF5050 domain-containing protein [Chloroflexi bacterium]|nr:DUF5050 domain-containing protein [Chloroflexota bacterium]
MPPTVVEATEAEATDAEASDVEETVARPTKLALTDKEPTAVLGTSAPILVWPPDDIAGPVIELIWKWDQPLADNEWFEVQIWPDVPGAQPTTFAWQKEDNLRITASHLLPGRYRWRVIVVRAETERAKCQQPPYPCPTCADWVVFQAAAANGDADIFRMRTDGSQVGRLTVEDGDDVWPSIGVDSLKVAFASNRDDNWEVYLMDIDGSNQTNVTNNADADDTAPSLSCDRIAFQSDRDGNWEIYSTSLDGTDQVRLTDDPAADEAPSWSPDGQWIAFQSNRGGDWDIYIMHQSGQDLRPLVTGSANDRNPNWSSDGHWIIFESDRDGQNELYKINLDTEEIVRLTDDPARDIEPVWTPYCGLIFWQSDRDGALDIYSMLEDGTEVVCLGTINNVQSWILSTARGRDKVRCEELSDYSEEGLFTIERPNTRGNVLITPRPTRTPTRPWNVWYPTATPTTQVTIPVPTTTSTIPGTLPAATPTSTPQGTIPAATPTSTTGATIPVPTTTNTPRPPVPTSTPTVYPIGTVPPPVTIMPPTIYPLWD